MSAMTYGRLSIPWQEMEICSRCADNNDILAN